MNKCKITLKYRDKLGNAQELTVDLDESFVTGQVLTPAQIKRIFDNLDSNKRAELVKGLSYMPDNELAKQNMDSLNSKIIKNDSTIDLSHIQLIGGRLTESPFYEGDIKGQDLIPYFNSIENINSELKNFVQELIKEKIGLGKLRIFFTPSMIVANDIEGKSKSAKGLFIANGAFDCIFVHSENELSPETALQNDSVKQTLLHELIHYTFDNHISNILNADPSIPSVASLQHIIRTSFMEMKPVIEHYSKDLSDIIYKGFDTKDVERILADKDSIYRDQLISSIRELYAHTLSNANIAKLTLESMNTISFKIFADEKISLGNELITTANVIMQVNHDILSGDLKVEPDTDIEPEVQTEVPSEKKAQMENGTSDILSTTGVNNLNDNIQILPVKNQFTRASVKKDSQYIYLFTDNAGRTSGKSKIDSESWYSKKYGINNYPGQTQAQIRGLDNAFPITTMVNDRRMNWSDDKIDAFKSIIDDEISTIITALNSEKFDGVKFNNEKPFGEGTISNMKSKAPKCWEYLTEKLKEIGIDNTGKNPVAIENDKESNPDPTVNTDNDMYWQEEIPFLEVSNSIFNVEEKQALKDTKGEFATKVNKIFKNFEENTSIDKAGNFKFGFNYSEKIDIHNDVTGFKIQEQDLVLINSFDWVKTVGDDKKVTWTHHPVTGKYAEYKKYAPVLFTKVRNGKLYYVVAIKKTDGSTDTVSIPSDYVKSYRKYYGQLREKTNSFTQKQLDDKLAIANGYKNDILIEYTPKGKNYIRKFLNTSKAIAISNEGTKLTEQYFLQLQENDFVKISFMYDTKAKKYTEYYAMVVKSYGTAVDIIAIQKDKNGDFVQVEGSDKEYKGKILTVDKNQITELIFLKENHGYKSPVFKPARILRDSMAGDYKDFIKKLKANSGYQKVSFEMRDDKGAFVTDTRSKTRRLGLYKVKNVFTDKAYKEWVKSNEPKMLSGEYTYGKSEVYEDYYWRSRKRKQEIRNLKLGDLVQFKKIKFKSVGSKFVPDGEIEIVAPFIGYRNGNITIDSSYFDEGGKMVVKHDEINIYNTELAEYKHVLTAAYKDVSDTANIVNHFKSVKSELGKNFDESSTGKVTRESILKPCTISQYYHIQQFSETKDASEYKAIASLQRGDIVALEIDLSKYDTDEQKTNKTITKYYIVKDIDEDTGYPIVAMSHDAKYDTTVKTYYKEFVVNPERITAIGRNKVSNTNLRIFANETLSKFTDKVMESGYKLLVPKTFNDQAKANEYLNKRKLSKWYDVKEVNLTKTERYATSIHKYFKLQNEVSPNKAYIFVNKKSGSFLPNSDVHTFPIFMKDKVAACANMIKENIITPGCVIETFYNDSSNTEQYSKMVVTQVIKNKNGEISKIIGSIPYLAKDSAEKGSFDSVILVDSSVGIKNIVSISLTSLGIGSDTRDKNLEKLRELIGNKSIEDVVKPTKRKVITTVSSVAEQTAPKPSRVKIQKFDTKASRQLSKFIQNVDDKFFIEQFANEMNEAYGMNIELLNSKDIAEKYDINTPQTHGKYSDFRAFTYGDTIVLNTDFSSKEDVLHEFSHVILKAIKFNNYDLYRELVEQARSEYDDYYKIMDEYSDLDFADLDEEVFSILFSKKISEMIDHNPSDIGNTMTKFADTAITHMLDVFAKYDDNINSIKLSDEDVMKLMTSDMTSIFASFGKAFLEKKFVPLVKDVDKIATKQIRKYARTLMNSNIINEIC